jgi:leucyl aminopeptidase
MDDIFPSPRIKLVVEESIKPGSSLLEFVFSDDVKNIFSPGKNLGSVIPVQANNGSIRYLVSLGEKKKADSQIFFKAGASFARWCNDHPVISCSLDLQQTIINADIHTIRSLLEGLAIGSFEFDRHKTKKSKNNQPLEIGLFSQDKIILSKEVARAVVLGESVDLARDWIHEPANVINPQSLEDRASIVAKKFGLTCNVIQYDELVKMGAGGISAVGRGSQVKPRLIVLEYKGGGSSKPFALVGKAITFDTGGYSLKGTDYIKGMKYDKAGGISVLATIIAAAGMKLKNNLVAVIPTAENMISGDAYRPDDILTLLSGLTVEITTTDAEGRLILADAITYTQNAYKPVGLIDIATLTGGVKIALGSVRAGLLSNNDTLAELMFNLGEKNGEKVWRLPMDDEYFDLIKGDDADMKNAGAREASTIVGGIFLKQVVDENLPWAHLDIAAMGETEHETAWSTKGPNGFGIRLMLAMIEELSNK